MRSLPGLGLKDGVSTSRSPARLVFAEALGAAFAVGRAFVAPAVPPPSPPSRLNFSPCAPAAFIRDCHWRRYRARSAVVWPRLKSFFAPVVLRLRMILT